MWSLSGIFCIWTTLSRNVCLPMMFFFLAVSEHTHTEAQQRALTNSRIRGCVQQARARSLPNSSTHMFTAAVCARGGAAAGWIEKVSERLQACRGARCSVSDWAAGGVCARRRGEAEGRLLLRGAGCIVERSACTWCCMMCVQAGCQAVQQTEQMSARARARAGACVRARLAWCAIPFGGRASQIRTSVSLPREQTKILWLTLSSRKPSPAPCVAV